MVHCRPICINQLSPIQFPIEWPVRINRQSGEPGIYFVKPRRIGLPDMTESCVARRVTKANKPSHHEIQFHCDGPRSHSIAVTLGENLLELPRDSCSNCLRPNFSLKLGVALNLCFLYWKVDEQIHNVRVQKLFSNGNSHVIRMKLTKAYATRLGAVHGNITQALTESNSYPFPVSDWPNSIVHLRA